MAKNNDYNDDEDWNDLVESFIMGIAAGSYPDFDYLRAALDHAEQLSVNVPRPVEHDGKP